MNLLKNLLTSGFTLLTLLISALFAAYFSLISTVDSKDDRVIEMMRYERSKEIGMIKEYVKETNDNVKEMRREFHILLKEQKK